MRDQARVVVIGGGIVGCSVLYHLTKLGWSDVMLVEKTELTAGSTWHAAGLLPLFNMSYSVGQLHKYSIDLYQQLEEETGQAVSFHRTGNLRLATNQERMDEYRNYCGTANTIGVPLELIGPDEIGALWPLANLEGLVGALFHPHDGHVAPVDVTQALAKGARDGGAEINRRTEVVAIERTRAGEWLVRTTRGDVTCETVVTAAGSWARQVGAMVGLDLPTIPVEHQYIVTDVIPELVERREAGLPEMPVLRESDASYYMREERQGLILGPFEKNAPAWAVDGVPEGFGQELLPPDVDRLEPHIEAAMKRVPMFARAGIKDCVNGPIPYTPDGNPLVGPAYGLPDFWLAEGFSFGITAAGGAGWQLAGWIANGEPSIDMLAVDPRRFGAYANKHYTKAKNEEAYAHVFVIHYPDEERPAARPAKTSPCHDRLAAHRAVWGQRYGWERPNWFAPDGAAQRDEWSFRRTNYFAPVGAECRAVRERAGLIDITSFSKFTVSGPGAEAALDRVLANRLPAGAGRIRLAHALTATGGVRSEFTVVRKGPQSFYLVSSGAAERYDHDFLRRQVAGPEAVVENNTTAFGVLVLAGPRARDILAAVTDADLSNNAFPSRRSRFPLASRAADFHWPRARLCDAGQFRGRAGLGASPPHRVPEPHLRRSGGGWRRARARHVRHAGDGFAQNREVLPHVGAGPHHRILGLRGRAGSLRRARQGRFHRPRGVDRPARDRDSAGLRHACGGCGRRRSVGQRADLPRGRDGGARDLGRLRPYAGPEPCAWLCRQRPCSARPRSHHRNSGRALSGAGDCRLASGPGQRPAARLSRRRAAITIRREAWHSPSAISPSRGIGSIFGKGARAFPS